MATVALPLPPSPVVDVRLALRRACASNRPLTIVALALFFTLAGTLTGMVLDDRTITEAPAWLKPAKFAVSLGIYAVTLVWLLGFVDGHRRLVGLAAWGTAAAVVIEQVIITGQAWRGTTSHFNIATPLDASLVSAKGAAVVDIWLMNLLTGVLLLRHRLPDPAFAWAVRLGILISFVGLGIAFLTIVPTEVQVAAREGTMTIAGAHAVGVPDGGAGLPLLGRRSEGGDLRAPYFVGLHGIQALPLVAWLLTRYGPTWLRPRDRAGPVWLIGSPLWPGC